VEPTIPVQQWWKVEQLNKLNVAEGRELANQNEPKRHYFSFTNFNSKQAYGNMTTQKFFIREIRFMPSILKESIHSSSNESSPEIRKGRKKS